MGANKPEEYGGLYHWGKSTDDSLLDLVRVEWGNKWEMPTSNHIQELIDYCTFKWTSLNGIQGGKFTGPNGNWIFMPSVGYSAGEELEELENEGNYWSITKETPLKAYCLEFDRADAYRYSFTYYDISYSIRPIASQ